MADASGGWKDRAAGWKAQAGKALGRVGIHRKGTPETGTLRVSASGNGAAPPKPGLFASAKAVKERVTTLVQLEVELARAEVKHKTEQIGIGVGLGVGAGIFAFIGLVFLFATIAAGLATFLDVWLALLIVTLLLIALCAICGLLAKSFVKKGTPPVPTAAIREAQLTSKALEQ
ncbi:MAG TPA: phage holin family protein [Gaiellaceae bacterium]|nr:phage holin family protein [Gaiellaceae bacterium]